MSALRNFIPLSAKDAEARLSRAQAAVEKREARLADTKARLAALEATPPDDDEGGVGELLVLRREILRTTEELMAYREAEERARKAHEEAVKAAEARQTAERAKVLQTRLEELRGEIEKRLEQLAALLGENESVRAKAEQIRGFGLPAFSAEAFAENASRRIVSRNPDKRKVSFAKNFVGRDVEVEQVTRKTQQLELRLVVPLVE